MLSTTMIMEDAKCFVDIMTNNRRKIVEYLLKDYSYSHLLELFSTINRYKFFAGTNMDTHTSTNMDTHTSTNMDTHISTNMDTHTSTNMDIHTSTNMDTNANMNTHTSTNTHTTTNMNTNANTNTKTSTNTSDRRELYRILMGNYSTITTFSAIEWFPSKELIDSILSLATFFDITTIEEIHAGIGILSSLLLTKSPTNIKITTSDTYLDRNTCDKLDFVPIAKRSARDFKYYHQLNEPCPQMIISSFYPENSDCAKNHDFLMELSDLICSKNHQIIVVFLPQTFKNFYELYTIIKHCDYSLYSFQIKALDKYFFVFNLFKKYYGSPMLAHTIIKNNLLIKKKPNYDIFRNAVIDTTSIDTNCKFYWLLKNFYNDFSPILIKSIFNTYEFSKCLNDNNKVMRIMQLHIMTRQKNIRNIPQYLYDVDEFIFWADCVHDGLFLVFESRTQFYEHYVEIINTFGFENKDPSFVRKKKHVTIYLKNIGEFRMSQFRKINDENLRILCE